MVFGWLYDRVGAAVIGQFENWLSDPKNIEQITKLCDSLVDREAQRIYSSLGASMQHTRDSASKGIDVGDILTGKLSSKKLIGTALSWWMNRKQGEAPSSSETLLP